MKETIEAVDLNVNLYVDQVSIRSRVLVSYFGFWQTIVGIPLAVMTSVLGAMMGFIGIPLSLPAPSVNICPEVMGMTGLFLDANNKAFCALVHQYHAHNNPILITFANILWEGVLRRRQEYYDYKYQETEIKAAERLF